MRFAAGILSKISYIPLIGRQTSQSATRTSVGTSRPHLNASFAGRIPGLGFELPPGASATTARISCTTSGEASAVQPPKLCPTIPIAHLKLLGFDHEKFTYRYAGRD